MSEKVYDNKNKCAIWVRRNDDGSVKMLSISVNVDGKDTKFVAWTNKYKEQGDKKPDYQGEIAKEKSPLAKESDVPF
jgi:hypothetical protein